MPSANTSTNSNKMPRKSKTTEPVVAAEPVDAAPAEPAPKKAKRAREPVAPAPEPETASETPAPSAALTIDEIVLRLKEVQKSVSEAIKDVQRLAKAHAKEVKAAAASQKRARRQRDPNAPPPKPSGITMKQTVSPELLKFFGKAEGTQLSRTDVSSLVYEYVQAKGLVNAEKKNQWNPDAPLRKLLRLADGEHLTMALTQKRIGVHFPEPAKAKKTA